MRAGNALGVLPLLDGRPPVLSARAATRCHIVIAPPELIQLLVARYPSVVHRLRANAERQLADCLGQAAGVDADRDRDRPTATRGAAGAGIGTGGSGVRSAPLATATAPTSSPRARL
jgi:CRP-like cAMP-binding protein